MTIENALASMSRRWIIRPPAESDLESASTWYEHQRTGLGSRLMDAMDRLFERVRTKPLQFRCVR
jgi:hypothetical protein